MPQLKKVKRVRDVTLILSLIDLSLAQAEMIDAHARDGEYNPVVNGMLVENLGRASRILTTLNASTGKREKGQGPALTPVGATSAAKSAKKAGARQR